MRQTSEGWMGEGTYCKYIRKVKIHQDRKQNVTLVQENSNET